MRMNEELGRLRQLLETKGGQSSSSMLPGRGSAVWAGPVADGPELRNPDAGEVPAHGERRAGSAAANPRRAAGHHVQAVQEDMGEESQSTSTWSRVSFAKARQSETSAALSNGPCSRPVAISITV